MTVEMSLLSGGVRLVGLGASQFQDAFLASMRANYFINIMSSGGTFPVLKVLTFHSKYCALQT